MEGKIYEQLVVENLYNSTSQEQNWSQHFEVNLGSYNFITLNSTPRI